MQTYEYRHVVGFEDTNVVGNVYYVNHLRWQGRCREMFLREHAPGIHEELRSGLCLATVRCSCDYYRELDLSDEILVRMSLADVRQNRITMRFGYWRAGPLGEELVARGEQQVAVMRRTERGVVPAPMPSELLAALVPYTESRQDGDARHVE